VITEFHGQIWCTHGVSFFLLIQERIGQKREHCYHLWLLLMEHIFEMRQLRQSCQERRKQLLESNDFFNNKPKLATPTSYFQNTFFEQRASERLKVVTSNQLHQSIDEYRKLLVWLSLVRVRSYVLSCLCLEILFFTSTCLRILVPWSRWPKSGKPSKGQYIIISAFFISTSHLSWFRSRRWFFNHHAHHRDEHRRFCNK